MLAFSCVTPHPPIIIPGIGQKQDLEYVKDTIQAMKKLSARFAESRPETVVLVSPHAPNEFGSFGINTGEHLRGDLSQFGFNQEFNFINDLELAEQIRLECSNNNIPTHAYASALDHGALVPLYYLTHECRRHSPTNEKKSNRSQDLPLSFNNSQNETIRLVHLSFSCLSFQTHYKYGETLGKVFKKNKNRIAFVASGDLSHRLIPGAPAGYSKQGRIFDEKLIKNLEEGNARHILNFDLNFVEEAGDCGLRSFIILLGVLNGKYNFDKLSYEGTFGVGYLVARLLQN